jgi:hypothetical protein
MAFSQEELVKVIRWELGIPVEQASPRFNEAWTQFGKVPGHKNVASSIAEPLRESVHTSPQRRQETPKRITNSPIRPTQPVVHASASSGTDKVNQMTPLPLPEISKNEISIQAGQTPEPPGDTHTETGSGSPNLGNQAESPQSPEPETTPPIVPQWKCLPVPDGPDKHTEFDSRCMDLPDGFKLIGARARGKKHKHEGTNCDDWFHFTVSGDWTIIAVSDGAGSKQFSRVGAEMACKAAVEQLAVCLGEHKVKHRDTWSAETFRRDDTNVGFAEEDLEFIQEALHQSMHAAYEAMEKAAAERSNSVDHFEVLGRRLEISDLSATLLLAVHTKVQFQNGETSLIFTCSIGDGMVAVIDKNGVTRLLMTPDSGQYSGEVTFLNKKEVQPEKLVGRTFPFLGTVRALLAMTDGVADDYFPNDPGMSLLYGDLILNQVVNIQPIDEPIIAETLSKTNLPTLEEVEKAEFHKLVERITDKDPAKVKIRSVAAYAEKLDLPVQDVLASPALLIAGSTGEPMCSETLPEEKLRVWLDSYQVRGSFDDRTLVILHREVL